MSYSNWSFAMPAVEHVRINNNASIEDAHKSPVFKEFITSASKIATSEYSPHEKNGEYNYFLTKSHYILNGHLNKIFSSDEERLIASQRLYNNVLPLETTTVKHSILSGVTDSVKNIPTLGPALSPRVQLSLTCVYLATFGLIFLVVYIQLWMIWYYRHKRLSHQTLFLFMCLLWAGLRAALFSFYFNNCNEANDLSIFLYWLLYCFPVCLQFSMLCLLVHFFAQVVFKARAKYDADQYKFPLRIFLGSSVLGFMTMNAVCAVVIKLREKEYASTPLYLVWIRVSLTEGMFFIYGTLLSICIFKMTKMASSRRVLEAKGTTVCRAVAAMILITFLFLSRTIYNLVSVFRRTTTPGFGYDWINVSDQVDAIPRLSESLAYASFGLVLFVWEVLPISIVVIFFRVKWLHLGPAVNDFTHQSHGSRVFFFDNPRRYDSEDDLTPQQNASPHPDANSIRSVNAERFVSSTSWGSPSSRGLISSSSSPPTWLPSTHRAGASHIASVRGTRGYGAIGSSASASSYPSAQAEYDLKDTA